MESKNRNLEHLVLVAGDVATSKSFMANMIGDYYSEALCVNTDYHGVDNDQVSEPEDCPVKAATVVELCGKPVRWNAPNTDTGESKPAVECTDHPNVIPAVGYTGPIAVTYVGMIQCRRGTLYVEPGDFIIGPVNGKDDFIVITP